MTDEKKILVVDDEQDWLHTIRLILGSDYDLTLTPDPSEAIELLKASDYSLVILDQKLSGRVSGVEVLSQMRMIRNELRAIVLTGYADVDSAVESMKIGALDYISKGAKELSSELKARVKEALEKRPASTNQTPDIEGRNAGGQLLGLIAEGEGTELEFKSFARWDIRANRINKELERVIVKTVAAFLNSEKGGTLLIGVDDKGTIVGLQQDYQTLAKRKDRDGYENFLTSILLDSYGKECSPLITITFQEIDGKDVCQIVSKPAPKPVWVRDDKGEHLFIRTGNSTRLLSSREAVEYCKIRWD